MTKLHQRIAFLVTFLILAAFTYAKITNSQFQDLSERGEELLENLKNNAFISELLPPDANKKDAIEKEKIIKEQKQIEKEKEKEKEREKEKEKQALVDPCTAIHPLTNGFYNLKELGSLGSEGKVTAWNAKGYDYGRNFTLSVCSTPFKQHQDVQDVSNSSNVGAFFTEADGSKFSIGEFSTAPHFRGKKLTLTYENGSYCDATKSNGEKVRKSTILSFTCDREIMQIASVSFVGVLNDCDYFFEVRSVHACPTAQKGDNLAVIWIFMFIFFAALAVYCSGGFIYKRMVLNHRGWKQLPNYGVINGVKSALRRSLNKLGIRNDQFDNDFGYLEDQNNLLDALDIDGQDSI